MRKLFSAALALAAFGALAHAARAQTSKYGIPSSHTPYIGAIQIPASTTAQLPLCDAFNAGIVRFVTDATTPTFNATLVGGGAVKVLAVCNGTNWITP